MGELCGRLADYGIRLIYGETRKFVYGEVPTNSACSAPLSAQKTLSYFPGSLLGFELPSGKRRQTGGSQGFSGAGINLV